VIWLFQHEPYTLHFFCQINISLIWSEDEANYGIFSCRPNCCKLDSMWNPLSAITPSPSNFFPDIFKSWKSLRIKLNWWNWKPLGSIACTRKQQPRFYWSCLSAVMNDATPLTPLAHERNSIFKCKQHTCTLHDPWGPLCWVFNFVVRFSTRK